MARRLVQADTLREGSHRQLMEAYLAAGEKAQALRHYDKLRKLLRDELGVEPSPETQALRDRIAATGNGVPARRSRTGRRAASAAAGRPPAPAVAAAVPPPRPPQAVAARRRSSRCCCRWPPWRPAGSSPGRRRHPRVRPSVAVLPFESLSGDADDARLAEGLTIDTIADLSRYADFRVMAKDTTDAYKGKPVDIRALGKDLKVSHVLKGTFQRDKDHIRITAQLIDAATGEALWSDRYDRLIGEIFAVQSDVADHIANSLGGREGKVGESLAAGARRKPPADLGAYELYLLAQETMYSDLSAEHMKEAQNILDQAIAKDPTFARAYVRYANTFAWLRDDRGRRGGTVPADAALCPQGGLARPDGCRCPCRAGLCADPDGGLRAGPGPSRRGVAPHPQRLRHPDLPVLPGADGRRRRRRPPTAPSPSIRPFPNGRFPACGWPMCWPGAMPTRSRSSRASPRRNGTATASSSWREASPRWAGRTRRQPLAKRGVAKFPGLLSIERFALNRGWPPNAIKVMDDLMRRAGFPACATAQDLADTPQPVRLPECTG